MYEYIYCNCQICIWSTDTWEKRRSFSLQLPAGELSSGDARVQFYSDQVHFLVSHETQLALYDATNEDCIQQVDIILYTNARPHRELYMYIF